MHATLRTTLVAGLALATLPAAAQVTAERSQIGTSTHGTPIEVVTIGESQPDAMGRDRHQRPAILLIAGVDGTHHVGTHVANRLIEMLPAEHAAHLADRTIYVIPSLSPDAAAWLAGHNGLPKMEWGRVPVSLDADGDRRSDEDGADDLNGDGMITMMRVANPHPSTGLTAEYVADEVEPRLLRKADREKGETPVYAIMSEGHDNDGDGSINEDGPGGSAGGGTHLDANFPSFWPEHREDAGLYPMELAESRALATWIQTRPNITAVVVYNTNDNLLNVPKTGQFDQNGQMPKGLEKADEAEHKHVADAFKEATGMTGAATRNTDGSLERWTYADLGLWTFQTPVWTRPDQVKPQEAEEAESAEAEAEAEAKSAEPEVSEYDALIARGVPDEFATFLTMSAEDQQAQIASYQNMSPEEQQSMMQQVAALPEDVRARLMAMATGGEDPGPSGSGSDAEGDEINNGKADKPGKSGADEAELAWLKYSDEDRNGEGFVEWTQVEHPQLGTVEVGGFVPGFRINPPDAELDRLAAEQTEFLGGLLGMLPEFAVGNVEVESLGGGLHTVHLTVHNHGYLPTTSAMGRKARRIVPVVAVVSVPVDDVIAGNRLQSVESIDGSGGTHTFEWTVRADNPAAISVDLRTGHFGNHTASQGDDQ